MPPPKGPLDMALRVLCCPFILIYQSIRLMLCGCCCISLRSFSHWWRWHFCACGGGDGGSVSSSGDAIDGRHFIDTAFPPNANSLGSLHNSHNEWTRLEEMIDGKRHRPVLVDGNISPADIMQGTLGDCWLLAAMAAVAEWPALIRKVFVEKKSNDYGKYTFRLFDERRNAFVLVSVDTFVPSQNGKPRFCSPKGGEMWVPLLEKAVAKLMGSYSALESGSTAKGIAILTGAKCVRLANQPQGWIRSNRSRVYKTTELFEIVHAFDQYDSIMTCSINEGPAARGISNGHAYTLLGAVRIDGIELIKVRNPWGTVDWRGPWSDGSLEWLDHPNVAKALKRSLMEVTAEGVPTPTRSRRNSFSGILQSLGGGGGGVPSTSPEVVIDNGVNGGVGGSDDGRFRSVLSSDNSSFDYHNNTLQHQKQQPSPLGGAGSKPPPFVPISHNGTPVNGGGHHRFPSSSHHEAIPRQQQQYQQGRVTPSSGGSSRAPTPTNQNRPPAVYPSFASANPTPRSRRNSFNGVPIPMDNDDGEGGNDRGGAALDNTSNSSRNTNTPRSCTSRGGTPRSSTLNRRHSSSSHNPHQYHSQEQQQQDGYSPAQGGQRGDRGSGDDGASFQRRGSNNSTPRSRRGSVVRYEGEDDGDEEEEAYRHHHGAEFAYVDGGRRTVECVSSRAHSHHRQDDQHRSVHHADDARPSRLHHRRRSSADSGKGSNGGHRGYPQESVRMPRHYIVKAVGSSGAATPVVTSSPPSPRGVAANAEAAVVPATGTVGGEGSAATVTQSVSGAGGGAVMMMDVGRCGHVSTGFGFIDPSPATNCSSYQHQCLYYGDGSAGSPLFRSFPEGAASAATVANMSHLHVHHQHSLSAGSGSAGGAVTVAAEANQSHEPFASTSALREHNNNHHSDAAATLRRANTTASNGSSSTAVIDIMPESVAVPDVGYPHPQVLHPYQLQELQRLQQHQQQPQQQQYHSHLQPIALATPSPSPSRSPSPPRRGHRVHNSTEGGGGGGGSSAGYEPVTGSNLSSRNGSFFMPRRANRDGTFYMSSEDFFSIFDYITIGVRTSGGFGDIAYNPHEEFMCCGPCCGLISGCAKFWCCCNGAKALFCARAPDPRTDGGLPPLPPKQ